MALQTAVRRKFTWFAWGFLVYNLMVILWGAYVRATGSGAGCGAHWPLCNGEVIPRSPGVETMIEFTHRVMSGLVLVLVVVLFVWARRAYAKHHPVRKAAFFSLFFTLTEALVGAGLVLFEMVADNTSIARAYWMIAHLINTFLLIAAITLTVWWSRREAATSTNWKAATGIPLVVGVLAMMILGASGAVTALGDTLFPASSIREGLLQDFSPESHLLVRLRVWHPVIAVATGAYLAAMGLWVRSKTPNGRVHDLSSVLIGLFLLQLLLGVINVILLAPVWMQLVHLLAADLVWITLVLLVAATLWSPGLVVRESDQPIHDRVKQAA